MIRRNPFGYYYHAPKGFGDVGGTGLMLPILLLISVAGTGAALHWWSKKKDEEKNEVSSLEGSKSLRIVEETIAQRKGY